MIKSKTVIGHKKSCVIVLLATVLFSTIVLINPFGHYAINDDWDFYTHVRNFRQGDFTKNSLIDSAFVLQGLIATYWTYIFGFSYNSLRVLTMLVTLLMLWGVYSIFKNLKTNKNIAIVGTILVLFNPFVLLSSVSFMTEVYFLCLVIWTVYFLFIYFDTYKQKNAVIAVVLASLSILVRQIGFLLAPAVIFLIATNDYKKSRRLRLKSMFLYVLVLIGFSSVLFAWPQYSNMQESKSLVFIINSVKSISRISILPTMLFYSIPYIGFSVLPLGIDSFKNFGKKHKLLTLLLTVVFFWPLYKKNLFKFGSVLYPEGLLIRSNHLRTLSILDNFVFKSVISFLCILSFVSSIPLIFENRHRLKNIKTLSLLLLNFSLLIPVLIYDGFYDRYMINALVLMVILICFYTRKISKRIIILTIFICIYSFVLVHSYVNMTKIQWSHAEKLREVKHIENRIFLSDTYTKYMYVFSKENSAQITKAMPMGIEYECYIQKTSTPNENNVFYKILNRIDTSRTVNSVIYNPKPFGSILLPGYRPPTEDPTKVYFLEEYLSIPERLIGIRTSVITYCNSEKSD